MIVGTDADGKPVVIFEDSYTSGKDPFSPTVDRKTSAMFGEGTSKIWNEDVILAEVEAAGSSKTGWNLKTHTEPKMADAAENVLKQLGLENSTDIKYILVGYQAPCQPGCQPLLRLVVSKTGHTIEYTGILDGTKWSFTPTSGVFGSVTQTSTVNGVTTTTDYFPKPEQ